jgi:hypothetical protein
LKPKDPRWSFLPSKDSFSSEDTPNESNSDVKSDEITDFKTTEIQAPPGQWYCVSDSRYAFIYCKFFNVINISNINYSIF